MNTLAIDFIIVVDKEGIVLDIELYNIKYEEYKFLEKLQSRKLNTFYDIDINELSAVVEIEHVMYVYQSIYRNNRYEIFFSQKTMESILFGRALDNIEEGIHIYNNQGYSVYLNEASEKLSGISKDEFIGKHLIDLYHLKEEYSTVLTTLRLQKPVINRCDLFTTKANKSLLTINSGFPIMIDDKLQGAILTENSIETLKKQAHKKLFLNEYMAISTDKKEPSKYFRFKDIIRKSTLMEDLIHLSKKVALNDSAVLIYGDTGTGKELLAQSIHSFGKNSDKPFVAVNCAAIPSNLAESLFFGTTKGAYTGSVNTEGFFSQANGGTLFLDEVNSMTLDMQSKLLRALQSKKYRKIGSQKESSCYVRIIAASNEDLYTLLEEKKIRSDFYYRISTIVLNLPSLSERREDIQVLVQHFINEFNKKSDKSIQSISENALELFNQYAWVGNIRELENVMEYAFALVSTNDTIIDLKHLPSYLDLKNNTYRIKNVKETVSMEQPIDTLEVAMSAYEKELIEKYLANNNWNISKTAKILNIKRQSLQYRIKKYNIVLNSAK